MLKLSLGSGILVFLLPCQLCWLPGLERFVLPGAERSMWWDVRQLRGGKVALLVLVVALGLLFLWLCCELGVSSVIPIPRDV